MPTDITLEQRLLFGFLALALIAFVARLMHRRQVDLQHAWPWVLAGLLAAVLAAFPAVLVTGARLLGFKVPSNAAMSLAITALVFLVLVQSVAIGRMQRDVRDLCQRMALLEAWEDEKKR